MEQNAFSWIAANHIREYLAFCTNDTMRSQAERYKGIGNYDGVKASREMLIGNYMKLGLKEEASKEAQLILDKSFKLES